jgi:hypothetical protein
MSANKNTTPPDEKIIPINSQMQQENKGNMVEAPAEDQCNKRGNKELYHRVN